MKHIAIGKKERSVTMHPGEEQVLVYRLNVLMENENMNAQSFTMKSRRTPWCYVQTVENI